MLFQNQVQSESNGVGKYGARIEIIRNGRLLKTIADCRERHMAKQQFAARTFQKNEKGSDFSDEKMRYKL